MCDQQSLRSACAYAQSDQSLCPLLEYSMTVKLLTEHHLEFLSLKPGCTGLSESTLVKMSHCWKSHVVGTQHPKYIFRMMGKKIITILCSFIGFANFYCLIISNSIVKIRKYVWQYILFIVIYLLSYHAADVHELLIIYGLRRNKTCLWGYRQIEIQTSLLSSSD